MQTTISEAVCPACAVTSSAFVLRGHEGIRLMRCGSCGLVFHNEFSDEAEIREYYDEYYDAENLAFSPITDRRFDELLCSFETYRQSNNILDIGCGSGHFLKVAGGRGWSAYGTEVASSAFEQLSKLRIEAFCGNLESASYAAAFFDIAYCSEVIEHLPDPVTLLAEIARIVRPGGLLYLTTPNFNSLSRRLLGSKWRVIGKEHVCYFTPATLARAIREAGFLKVVCRTRNIDPNEIKRAFSRNPIEVGTGFQTATTEALRHQLETRPALRFAKSAVNFVLRTTGTGDTIVARAER
ncbi:MAG TPA: class I SAM-dependent methyltransferase [Blastocatellia bacterium]|nr:class I SAM-dependent methyltransferase [Blastocatellia bacterium]